MLWYSDMFLYLIMLNLLKESYALHAIQLWMIMCCNRVKGAKFGPIFHTQFVDKWHVWFVGLCVDGSANYSSQVLHVAYLPISGSYFSRWLFLKGIHTYIHTYISSSALVSCSPFSRSVLLWCWCAWVGSRCYLNTCMHTTGGQVSI